MKKFILILGMVCCNSILYAATNIYNNEKLVGYSLSDKYKAFARISGIVQKNHADLTILTNVYPWSISNPVETTASIDINIDNININKGVCATGKQTIPNRGSAIVNIDNCTLDTINNRQILHGHYYTTPSSRDIKNDEGLISVDYPFFNSK